MIALAAVQAGRFAAMLFFDPPRRAPVRPKPRMVRADNFRAAPLDALQVDVFRAFVETLPVRGER